MAWPGSLPSVISKNCYFHKVKIFRDLPKLPPWFNSPSGNCEGGVRNL